MKIITDEACLHYEKPGHPETPQRVGKSLEALRARSDWEIDWASPGPIDDALILEVHGENHLESLSQSTDFDDDTPTYPGIEATARIAVAGALDAMHSALAGQTALSLLRPPGHHAGRDRAMGFCYLNQIAAAAVVAARDGRRVAVYDFDVHHGNGTEDILRGRDDLAYFSVHQSPCYPGTGLEDRDNARNFPMPPDSPRKRYTEAFRRALDALLEFKPDLIAVSAGFDAFIGDPLAQERVEMEDYRDLGRAIRDLGLPCFAVLEGGYSAELPDLIIGFLEGLDPRGSSTT